MFNKEKFGDIIKKINASYPTQYDFAEKSNVNRTYLSQYINQKLSSPPKPNILKRIAEASKGITSYEELMQICGYTNLTDAFFDESISQQKDNNIPVIDINDIYFENDYPVIFFYGTQYEKYINANFDLDKNKEYFAVKTNDEAMSPALGIGDIAILEKTNIFQDGQICLIALDNKQLLIRGIKDYKSYIELQALNYHFESIKLTKEEMEKRKFKIIGKVVKAENESFFK